MFDYTKKQSFPSIHIVIFTGGDYPSVEATQVFWQHMPYPDYVVAADSGLVAAREYAQKYAFDIDVILGDMDSLQDVSLLSLYPKERVKPFPVDKDFTDTELALHTAYQKDSDCFVTVIGGDGGRIDHLIGIFDLFATKQHPHVWLGCEQALWYVGKGMSLQVSNLQSHDVVSIARTTQSRTGGCVSVAGLEWGSDVFRKEGMPSISNRLMESFVAENKPLSVQVTDGAFVLFLPLTAIVTSRC